MGTFRHAFEIALRLPVGFNWKPIQKDWPKAVFTPGGSSWWGTYPSLAQAGLLPPAGNPGPILNKKDPFNFNIQIKIYAEWGSPKPLGSYILS